MRFLGENTLYRTYKIYINLYYQKKKKKKYNRHYLFTILQELNRMMLLSRAIVPAYAIVVFRPLIIFKFQEHSVEL